MKTLYIDVYFLLNFSVDLLAVYFSLCVVKIPTRFFRLVFCGILAAAYSVFCVFISGRIGIVFALAFLTMALMATVVVKKCSFSRRLRFCFFFLVFETLLAGMTYYLYSLFAQSRLLSAIRQDSPAENRNYILAAALILFGIGIVKLMKAGMSKTVDTMSKTVCFSFLGKDYSTVALIDSGNLLCDPMSGTPVMLTGRRGVFPTPPNGDSFFDCPSEIRKKVRIVPFRQKGKAHLLYAWKPDRVTLKDEHGEQEISLLIAYDKEGGNYGGFESLLPYAAIADVT